MPLPFFYTTPIPPTQKTVVLDEVNSKHIVQVLRMQVGEQLKLTDGLGNIYTAQITDAHKKKCTVQILQAQFIEAPTNKVCIAISPVKNNSRLEWFLEKATEIGVTEIVLLLCQRTEKQYLKLDRLNGILISAMLQSQQAWLPVLNDGIKFEKFVIEHTANNLFIAHCEEDKRYSLKELINQPIILSADGVSQSTNQATNQSTILIGPEGDFTTLEIAFALQHNYTPVTLGTTRLRTETAAMVAAVILCVA